VSSNLSPGGVPIEGAIALVTGGNRGFGQALVDEFLQRGAAKVYVTSRSVQPAPLRDDRLVALALDVSDDASVEATAAAAPDVSIVVNNAGISLATPVLEAPLSAIREEMETNLFGIIRVARAFGPVLADQGRSSMVNVLSALSWFSFGRGYEISKAAAWSATNALRLALRDQGTIVTALHVGYMDTDMTAGIDAPKADPRDIARQAADGIVAGDFEILADEASRTLKTHLSESITTLYTQLAVG
jgi:NAD(P)-dependent dehydrogenase (short-subunit alcohol dehydrogenase family)